jgi:uncharacterized protein
MRELIAGLTTGFIFGLGMCFSRMTDPAVVQGFLDVAGAWDPTLMAVMVGGVAVTFFGYRLVMRRSRPLWATKFSLPGSSAIDAPLLGGAAIFGIGWGLAGYCPAPAIVSLASGRRDVILFVISMLVGMTAVRWMRSSRSATMRPAATQGSR